MSLPTRDAASGGALGNLADARGFEISLLLRPSAGHRRESRELAQWAAWTSKDADIQKVDVHDDEHGAWVLRINVEDGAPRAWVYRRDPRLMLPWDKAIIDVDGIPTGAPAVQLLWKALRPRPVDDLDKDAILPKLSDEERTWLETALLRIHPHSSWAIHVRSPFAPAKASWNKKRS